MLTLIFKATILINFIESKYLLVETEKKNDGEGSDYESVPADICVTTFDINYVCGVDCKTYVNPSVARCKGIEVQCGGECPCEDDGRENDDNEDDLCGHTGDINHVCGVDGKTYDNPSVARCNGVEVQCDGECPCDDAGSGNDDYQDELCSIHYNCP